MKYRNTLVSIIIPCYNSGAFLADAIESALGQTWPNIEIIIVDDGSTDNSLDIARQYTCQPNIKVFERANHGSAATRNFGFLKSAGDFIQYLDADDVLSSDKISKQLELLSNYDEGFISSCPWFFFKSNVQEAVFRPQGVWDNFKPIDWLVAAWTGGGMMQTACWLTPRSVVAAAGPWNESFRRNPNDDGEFFCRAILQSKGILFQPASSVFYRRHEGQRVSTSMHSDAVSSLLGTCESYERNIFKYEKSARTMNAVIANYVDFLYRFNDEYPDLAKEARQHLRRLGPSRLPLTGGKHFKVIAWVIGFDAALRIRSITRAFSRKLSNCCWLG